MVNAREDSTPYDNHRHRYIWRHRILPMQDSWTWHSRAVR